MSPDQRFSVPEPPPGIGTGVLAEIWDGRKPMPTLKGMELVSSYLLRGLHTCLALPASNAITVTTMALSLFLLSGFLLILQNIDKLIAEAGTTLSVTAYLRENAPENEVKELMQQLRTNSRVRSVNYVSKQDALNMFKRDLGSRSGFLAGLEGDKYELAPFHLDIDIAQRTLVRRINLIDVIERDDFLQFRCHLDSLRLPAQTELPPL